MATQAQVKNFIATIAPLIQKYAKSYGYKVASPIIAQACLESGYGTSSLGSKYHNYFGMKCGSSWNGKSVNLNTMEEYTAGTMTQISANFRVYDSMEEGVKGYFEFISRPRYANLKTATTANQYLTMIKEDGYATASTYVSKNMNVVEKYNLTQYDTIKSKNIITKVTSAIKGTSKYYDKYTGTSYKIDEIFAAIGVPAKLRGNVANRTAVANANGIAGYGGTAKQNTALITLAKQGKLLKP